MKVFVTVGTHSQQFNRLLKKVDEIAREKNGWNFFAQIGNSSYKPKNLPYKKFLEEKEYEESFKQTDIVISHAGAGSIINALRFKKPLIVVPRLNRFGEHTNDHQLELGEFFEGKRKCLCVKDTQELENEIEMAKKFKPRVEEERKKLVKELKNFLHSEEMKK